VGYLPSARCRLLAQRHFAGLQNWVVTHVSIEVLRPALRVSWRLIVASMGMQFVLTGLRAFFHA